MDDLTTLREKLTALDEEERRMAVIGLACHPIATAREGLFVAMGDGSWRVRKEAVNKLLDMAPDDGTVDGLIALLASSENAGLRNSAVEALERLGTRAVPLLLEHLKDPDHDVRKFVVDILGNIGDRSCIPGIVTCLEDPDANVSAAAAENLGKIGDSRAVQPLLAALASRDVWFRYSILGALARIGEPLSVAVLAPLTADNLLRRPVFECMGAVGGREAVPLLVDGIFDRIRAVRETAASALIKLRERLSVEDAGELDARLVGLRGTPGIDVLVANLDSPDQSVRESLVGLLAIIGDERAALPLLQGCRDERIRRLCLKGFRAMGERGMAVLRTAFASGDDDEKAIIMHLWGEMGFAPAAPQLREGMRSDRAVMRRAAVVAAGKIGLAEAAGEIGELLDNADPEVRDGAVAALVRLAAVARESVEAVAQTLGTSGDADRRRDATRLYAALSDAERLALLVKDENPVVRRSALTALAGLRLPATLGSIAMALVDEDPDVRIAAATGLGEVDGAAAVDPLILSLNDDDPWVRCAAVRSLGRIGGERSLDAIEGLFSQAEGVVLITVLETLAGMSGERAMAVVKRGLENPDEEVVKTAIAILSRVGESWVDECRERLISHPHWDVRCTFIRTMAHLLGGEAVPHLKRALASEEDELVRREIRDMLGRYQYVQS